MEFSFTFCWISHLQHFVKSDDAGAALSALDDSEFMGSHIQVQVPRLSTALGVSNCHQFVF